MREIITRVIEVEEQCWGGEGLIQKKERLTETGEWEGEG